MAWIIQHGRRPHGVFVYSWRWHMHPLGLRLKVPHGVCMQQHTDSWLLEGKCLSRTQPAALLSPLRFSRAWMKGAGQQQRTRTSAHFYLSENCQEDHQRDWQPDSKFWQELTCICNNNQSSGPSNDLKLFNRRAINSRSSLFCTGKLDRCPEPTPQEMKVALSNLMKYRQSARKH